MRVVTEVPSEPLIRVPTLTVRQQLLMESTGTAQITVSTVSLLVLLLVLLLLVLLLSKAIRRAHHTMTEIVVRTVCRAQQEVWVKVGQLGVIGGTGPTVVTMVLLLRIMSNVGVIIN